MTVRQRITLRLLAWTISSLLRQIKQAEARAARYKEQLIIAQALQEQYERAIRKP